MKKSGAKKLLCMCLVLLLVEAFTFSAFADEPALCYTYLGDILVDFDISSSGYADMSGGADVEPNCSVDLVLKLQRYVSGTWKTVTSTSASDSANIENGMYVAKGYTYRAALTAKVYNSAGRCVETVTIYSNEISY